MRLRICGDDGAAHHATMCARGDGFSPPADRPLLQARAESIDLHVAWQPVGFARYTVATGSFGNKGRDQITVWALPGQS